MKIKITNKKTGKTDVVDSDIVLSLVLNGEKYNSSIYQCNAYSHNANEDQSFEFVNDGELSVSEHLAKIKELIG